MQLFLLLDRLTRFRSRFVNRFINELGSRLEDRLKDRLGDRLEDRLKDRFAVLNSMHLILLLLQLILPIAIISLRRPTLIEHLRVRLSV